MVRKGLIIFFVKIPHVAGAAANELQEAGERVHHHPDMQFTCCLR